MRSIASTLPAAASAAFLLLTAAGASRPAPSKSPMPAFKRWVPVTHGDTETRRRDGLPQVAGPQQPLDPSHAADQRRQQAPPQQRETGREQREAGSPPLRYAYGYTNVSIGHSSQIGPEECPFLTSITVPSPTGTGTATAGIEYEPDTCTVKALTDGNGNRREYSEFAADTTQVTLKNSAGATLKAGRRGSTAT